MTLEEFDGIKIECYSGDHLPPHIHARYAEYMDRIIIESGELMEGSNLPNKKSKVAVEYVLKNKKLLNTIFFLMNQNLKRR
jgi:hypothetical protein